MFFDVGCNEQVLFLTLKTIGADPSCRYREKHKNRLTPTSVLKNWRHRAEG